ncbi:MAG TPA: hypothetical protein DCS93_35710 [Microscillaceae bacterium]|nr:hypothetical protein [Microscillaceae bacterium]
MKKLGIENGGHLASNDDLMHLEKKTTDIVEVIFRSMLKNPQVSYKLYGCTVSEDVAEGTLKVTEGAIFHQKEFYLVTAQSIPLQTGGAYGFKITDNPNAPGTKVIYASGSEVTPHQDQVMILTYEDFDLAGASLEQFSFKHLTPSHEWSGTQLRFEFPSGNWGPFVDLKGPKGDRLAHEWSGTQLRFQNQNGAWGPFVNLQGPQGNTPSHEWSGTQLRFQNSDGNWGPFADLKGQKGDKGDDGKDNDITFIKAISAPSTSYIFPRQLTILEVQFPDGAIGYIPTTYQAG